MRRLLLIAVGLPLVAAFAPLQAINKYVAIGDSITVGSSWPVLNCNICPVVFDCVPGCDATDDQADRDRCGHARRLDDWLAGGGANYVQNRGIGGEKTDAAASRFAGEMAGECPGSPGDCIAVILMHGTNDMNDGSISPESARDNLAFMIAEAKSRNIDTLLMSIIRKVYDKDNDKWEDYRDLIAALAAAEDLQLVDPWATLCNSDPCFDSKYWVDPPPACDQPGEMELGHLDQDGYDDLTDLITAVFPAMAPAAPVPTAPTGDITDNTPDFVWPEVPDARWYELDLGAGTTTWWEAAAHCSGGTCTVNPGVALAEGAHLWKVWGRNLRGLGDPSADTSFHVWGVPGTPAPSDPEGLQVEPDPMTTQSWEPYTWSEDPEATDYDIEVSNGGGPVFSDSFDSASCAGSCTGWPGQGLAAGSYTWTVQARNPGASGPVSAPLAFEIRDTAPDEAIPTGPTGEHFEPYAPLYEWLPAAGADKYNVVVRDMASNIDYSAIGLLAADVCAGGSCSHQGGILASPDVYTLKVAARNSIGSTAGSTSVEFTVLACANPAAEDLEVLEPGPVTTTKTVTHCGPVTAGTMGPYEVSPGGDLTVHTRDGFSAADDFTVLGNLTILSP